MDQMLMFRGVLKIPIWPEAKEVPMTFLHGEPGWYLWLLHQSTTALNCIERDMMLLYNNGDLLDFPPELKPEPGIFICTLAEDKLIRGLILNKYKDLNVDEGSMIVLDVDSGKVIAVPKTKMKVLPTFATKAAARAVRVDLGLDCKERFDWAPAVDDMLRKFLSGASLVVSFESERPGSIPTVSVSAQLWTAGSPSKIEFRDWIVRYFGPMLEVFALERYLPHTVYKGSTENHLEEVKPEGVGAALSDKPNSWNLYGDQLFPNQIFTQVVPPPGLGAILPGINTRTGFNASGQGFIGPPPGFNVLTQFSPMTFNQGFAYPPLPWPGVWPDLPDSTDKYVPHTPLTPVSNCSSNSLPSAFGEVEKNTSWPSRCPNVADSGYEGVPVCAPPAVVSNGTPISSANVYDNVGTCLPTFQPRVQTDIVRDSASKNPDNVEMYPHFAIGSNGSEDTRSDALSPERRNESCRPKAPTNQTFEEPKIVRSTTPVLTVESLLEESASLNTNTMTSPKSAPKKERTLTVDSLQECSALMTKPADSVIRNGRAANSNANAEALRSATQSRAGVPNGPRGHKHIILVEIKRDWKIGTVLQVIMSCVVSPGAFTANVVDVTAQSFNRLQKEMENYCGSLPLEVECKENAFELLGNFCVCYDVEEDLWFRAEVLEWRFEEPEAPVTVWAVDFGGIYNVPLMWIRGLEGYVCRTLPIQSTLFSMHNVRPRKPPFITDWPEEDCVTFRKLMPIDREYWLRLEKPVNEGAWPVSVFTKSGCQSVCLNDIVVEKKIAFYSQSISLCNQPSAASVTGSNKWDPMQEDFDRGGHDYNVDDEDACYAVSGFKPRDEKNVCRFFSESGNCPKGLNCRQRHVRLREGGWTSEKDPVYTTAFADLELPAEGSVFSMKVTCINNVHHLIGCKIPDKVSRNQEHIEMLLRQMNNPSEVRTFESLKVAPAIGELVIAKDNVQNYWFRARVMDVHYENESIFEVRDVDTGEKKWVTTKNMREMKPDFLHLPFQAIECYLAGMVPVCKGSGFSEMGIARVKEIVRSRLVKVYVVKRVLDEALEVNVSVGSEDGRGGEDLTTVLFREGFVQRGANRISSSHVVKYRPG